MGDVEEWRLYNCSDEALGGGAGLLNRSALLEALVEALRERPSAKVRLQQCLFPDQEPHDQLALWHKILWVTLFAAMLFVAVTGNAIVIWIVLGHRRMRTRTNCFLVNLSVADLLMSLLNCAFNLAFMLEAHWPFGPAYCALNNFVANLSVAASVFTLVAISLDRYMAIVRPLKHRMTRGKARLALIAIWAASALLALPCLLYSTTATYRSRQGEERTRCFMLWPDGNYPKSLSEHVYNVVFLAVTYLGPVIAMAICYTIMGRELWGSKSIGEQTQRQLDNIKSKRKVVRMFVTVISIFTICWLPYHGYFIYAYENQAVAFSSYVPHLYLAFYWLAMSNAMVNPIIYYWMNTRFRVYFRQVMCEWWCRPHDPDAISRTNRSDLLDMRTSRSKSCKSHRQNQEVEVSGLALDENSICSGITRIESFRGGQIQSSSNRKSQRAMLAQARYD